MLLIDPRLRRQPLGDRSDLFDRSPESGIRFGGETYRILLLELAEARVAERPAMGLGTAIEHSCSEVQS